MLYVILIEAALAAVVLYVALEQAWMAAETGEEDILHLAPAIASLRGIDYPARVQEYELRMSEAFGLFLDALDLEELGQGLFDQEAEEPEPATAKVYPYPQPTRQELLDAKAWLEEYHDEYERREIEAARAANPELRPKNTSACADCREPSEYGSRYCLRHRYAREQAFRYGAGGLA